MFRSDKVGQLCLSLPEVPSNFAKDNRLTNKCAGSNGKQRFIETPYIFLAVSLLHQKRKCSENY